MQDYASDLSFDSACRAVSSSRQAFERLQICFFGLKGSFSTRSFSGCTELAVLT